eukprot:69354_1
MAVDLSFADFATKQWDNDRITIDTDCKKIHLLKSNNAITFHNNNDKEIDDFKEVMELLSNTDSIYLEWVCKYTGQYLYYNIHAVLTELQSCNINVDILSKNRINDININDLCLTKRDILIVSPMRNLYSLTTGYTLMGEYHGGSLYLGKWPIIPFLKNQSVTCIFNCCRSPSDEAATLNITEIVFDVANWKYALIDELTTQNKNKTNKEDIDVHRSKQFKRLDEAIDKMHEYMTSENKNVLLVHCHAGMHRSPFIIGCYLMKYGGEAFENESVENIYSFMKTKRKIVQEFGYDKTLKRYKQYMDAKQQGQGSCSCCIL